MAADPPGRTLAPATRAARSGRSHEPGAAVNPALALSSTFRRGGDDLYARDDNETWEALEEALADLEGGKALCFASGMAAISAMLELAPVGARVVVGGGIYNGTTKWCADAHARGRLQVETVDVTDADAVVAASAGAALVWLESPTNPLLDVADIAAITAGARKHGAMVVVDSTLATPYLQRPLDLGAHAVVHSVTKWIAGHSDLLLGAVVTDDEDLLERVRSRRSLFGGIAGTFEAWLALRGLRTLPARLERAQASAALLAGRLAAHPAVERVRYPGLADDPGHEVAARQMSGYGGVVSFEVRGGAEAADAAVAALELLTPGTSLGGVETLIERRSRYAFEDRTPPGLLRMSVGQEDVEDLWWDLDQALRSGSGPS